MTSAIQRMEMQLDLRRSRFRLAYERPLETTLPGYMSLTPRTWPERGKQLVERQASWRRVVARNHAVGRVFDFRNRELSDRLIFFHTV
jgi:hypothetical protein